MIFVVFYIYLRNDIKSEIGLFTDYVKLLVKSLSKELTQMDDNRLLP